MILKVFSHLNVSVNGRFRSLAMLPYMLLQILANSPVTWDPRCHYHILKSQCFLNSFEQYECIQTAIHDIVSFILYIHITTATAKVFQQIHHYQIAKSYPCSPTITAPLHTAKQEHLEFCSHEGSWDCTAILGSELCSLRVLIVTEYTQGFQQKSNNHFGY